MAIRFIVMLLALVVGQALADSYQARRAPFWSELYGEGGWTLYCAERFESAARDPERRRGLNIEHVYPASWVVEQLGCGSRKKCRRVSDRFNTIEADPHNLWPALAQYNQVRSNFRFGYVSGERWRYSSCDFEYRDGVVEPSPRARGRIARSMLYMRDTYGLAIDEQLMLEWHQAHPVDDEERRRAAFIRARWGLVNPWLE